MDLDEGRPIFLSTPTIQDEIATFNLGTRQIRVNTPRSLMRQLLCLCNGQRSKVNILSTLELEWDRNDLLLLLGSLEDHGVLVDSCELMHHSWVYTKNPTIYPRQITNEQLYQLRGEAEARQSLLGIETQYQPTDSLLSGLLQHRQSTRTFINKPTNLQILINILWSAYGCTTRADDGFMRKTVPSAGALDPLVVHLVLHQFIAEFSPGVYRVRYGESKVVELEPISSDILAVHRAFLEPSLLEQSLAIIIISGSFQLSGRKYGNRSVLYVSLEAGHVAQNVHLSAQEQGLASVEIGGFSDDLLTAELRLEPEYYPLTTVVFGYAGHPTSPIEPELDWVIPIAGSYKPPFSVVLARVSPQLNDDWSYGRDEDPAIAKIKAISEAREWAACGCPPELLVRSSFLDLPAAINPRSIVNFHPSQYRQQGFPFVAFDEQVAYEWVEAQDQLSGEMFFAPADLTFFPYETDTPIYAYANSSGVAAHPNLHMATVTATLELIERDSFMNYYLGRLISPSVMEDTLPDSILKRIKLLNQEGFQVWVKDHSLDLAPVVFIYAQSQQLHCTICAASCNFDPEQAISHALMEVEASVLARLQQETVKSLLPHQVVMPNDHGSLYMMKRFFMKADFMADGPTSLSFKDIGSEVATNWQQLTERVRDNGWHIITTPLTLYDQYGGNAGLSIIRSFVPGLTPMTFGYRQEPAGMNRIYDIAQRFGGRSISYRDVVGFPHPFS